MSIIFDSEKKIFNISTENSSYIMGIIADGILTHIYHGKKIDGIPNLEGTYSDLTPRGFSPRHQNEYPSLTLTSVFQEYPTDNCDYRTSALNVDYADGSNASCLLYEDHKIFKGKPALEGLPAVYAEEDEAESLEITLKDKYSEMRVVLLYSIVKGYDAVIRSAKIVNNTKERIVINKALSASVDFYNSGFDITYFAGEWSTERHPFKKSIDNGNFSVYSKRGASSHVMNPFFIISSKNADEDHGDAFGYSFVYSGNFVGGADGLGERIRAYMGINPDGFRWNLEAGESFQTPETVIVYSSNGFGDMSRTYHRLYNRHLCRGKYRDTHRPILINNWEATLCDFDEEMIVNIARKASECGIELMVLDDGWFGKRYKPDSSLGDWYANTEKLPNGINGLADKVNALGMKFGLWFEPEMISPNSDLYRAHPDWCIHQPGRVRTECRSQLILDLSRPEVCDYVVNAVSNVLENANIEYVKWDMNRNMTEVGSACLDGEHQRELPHRYMLGLYSILEKLTSKFPNVLFESCSGGGGRFDPGMMHYMPQAWVSDDTDGVERLYLQYGTSFCYSSSMMGSHVTAVPNDLTGRTTPLNLRGNVAMNGRFGYELDLNKLTDEEIEEVKQQVKDYREIEHIVHKGDMYRLVSPFEKKACALEYVSEDENEVLFFYNCIQGKPSTPCGIHIPLKGLKEDSNYQNTETGEIYSGAVLMNMGLIMPTDKDHFSVRIKFKKV